MRGRVLAAGLAALWAVRAAAGGPPVPPPDHAPVALSTGASWTAPAGGGVCLDRPAVVYQLERQAWDEARLAEAKRLAEERPLKVVAWSAAAGFIVGGLAVAIVAARSR
jgi:hypothetical protein